MVGIGEGHCPFDNCVFRSNDETIKTICHDFSGIV